MKWFGALGSEVARGCVLSSSFGCASGFVFLGNNLPACHLLIWNRGVEIEFGLRLSCFWLSA